MQSQASVRARQTLLSISFNFNKIFLISSGQDRRSANTTPAQSPVRCALIFTELKFKTSLYLTKPLEMTTRDNILSVLRDHKRQISQFGVSNICLFGSYLRNEQSAKSDIDLLIDFEPGKENFDNYMAVYDFFENLFKNEKIEIVTKNGLSKYIGPKILNNIMYV